MSRKLQAFLVSIQCVGQNFYQTVHDIAETCILEIAGFPKEVASQLYQLSFFVCIQIRRVRIPHGCCICSKYTSLPINKINADMRSVIVQSGQVTFTESNLKCDITRLLRTEFLHLLQDRYFLFLKSWPKSLSISHYARGKADSCFFQWRRTRKTRYAMYVQRNIVAYSRTCCSGKATIIFVCIVEVNDTLNNITILIVAQEWYFWWICVANNSKTYLGLHENRPVLFVQF